MLRRCRRLVAQVKPLGVFAMIDDGELDWKIIAINVEDPLADKLNDVEDVERCGRSQPHPLAYVRPLKPACGLLQYSTAAGCMPML